MNALLSRSQRGAPTGLTSEDALEDGLAIVDGVVVVVDDAALFLHRLHGARRAPTAFRQAGSCCQRRLH
eukprot:363116-Chlamydomonas_euryale.AAC.5